MMRYPKAKWLGQTANNSGKFKAGQPRFLVCHYTAGGTAESSAELMMRESHKASAPFVVDRDGAVLQLSETNIVCWHAGISKWRDIKGLNRYSVGIEFANFGFMKKVGDRWMLGASDPIFSKPYNGNAEIIEAAHRNDPTRVLGWESFPEAQIESGLLLAWWLLEQFPTIEEVIGHDDISPGRKSDPGPAFPMARFAALTAKDGDEADHYYIVSAGETLWRIAQENGTTVEALQDANGLASDTIHPGQGLVIP